MVNVYKLTKINWLTVIEFIRGSLLASLNSLFRSNYAHCSAFYWVAIPKIDEDEERVARLVVDVMNLERERKREMIGLNVR